MVVKKGANGNEEEAVNDEEEEVDDDGEIDDEEVENDEAGKETDRMIQDTLRAIPTIDVAVGKFVYVGCEAPQKRGIKASRFAG